MKRNLGSVLALYPTPAVVVGTFVQEKVNWVLVAHVGIIGHNRILVSLAKPHGFTGQTAFHQSGNKGHRTSVCKYRG